MGYTRGMTRPLLQLGGFFRQRGDWAKALPYYKKALRLSHEIGDQEGMAFAHVDVARALYATTANFDEAAKHLSRALDIANETGFILSKCRTLQVMATLYAQAGQGSAAVLSLQRVLEVAHPAGYRVFVEGAKRQLALLTE
jgi:tetratricopeptide (TPR) repeat protein